MVIYGYLLDLTEKGDLFMPFLRRKGLYESNRVFYLPVSEIVPNPNQPRTVFSSDGLVELSASIREHGVLQPLSVRRTLDGYELVSGERRLRAAKLAGLREVPCILLAVDGESSSLLALVENLQRRDLDFLEEAAALQRLIQTYGLSQEEAARKIGKSQSAVANKLRLLRLPADVLDLLRRSGLTERHARALLRLDDPGLQRQAAQAMVDRGLTVAQSEAYIEDLLSPPQLPVKKRKPTYIIKDVRLFLNTVTHGLSVIQAAGIPAACDRRDTDDAILLTIKIPKQPA